MVNSGFHAPSIRAKVPAVPRKRATRVRLALDERRAQLLSLGRALFNTRTYDEISIDDIAGAAGISKGLLYHYFPSKRRFFVEAVRAGAAEMLTLTEPPESDAPPGDRLRIGLDAYLDYVEKNARAYAWLLRTGVGVDPEVREVIEETRQAVVDRIVQGVGVTTPPPQFRIALRGWIGLVEAASLDWIEHDRDLGRDALRDLLIVPLQALFVGVAPETTLVDAPASPPRARRTRAR